MRIAPRSLFGRLLAISAVSTLVALVVAGMAIGRVLERFVIHGLDDRLDAEVALLARAVRPDGTVAVDRMVQLPGFDEPGSGWTWRVEGARVSLGNAPGGELRPDRPGPPDPDRDRPRPGDREGHDGERVHFRTLSVPTAAGPVEITAAAPRRIVEAPLREAMTPLLATLALLGAALAAATLVQLRIGLRPLGAMRAALTAVREGREARVPQDQPNELVPLVAELNALLDQNETGLAHARQHVANLAHGIKTPLAALAITLAEEGRDPDGRMTRLVTQIDERVRHHLGRARAAAAGGSRSRTPLGPAIADLVDVLRRVHADSPVGVDVGVASELAVAVDGRDLDEMIGNLLDNAWRHARTTVRVAARADGGRVLVEIGDDGPGLQAAELAEAMLPGRRLDERGDGHGFGLPIARELAELSGGTLTLANTAQGTGLRALLSLPAR